MSPGAPAGATRHVLVLNAGSSSLKAALVGPPGVAVWRDEVDWGADASRQADRVSALTGLLAGLDGQSTDSSGQGRRD